MRHVIFFEEAHNLIGPKAEVEAKENASPKTAATAFIIKMLADEVQLERMASFTQGKALAIYEGLLKPFEIQIHQWSKIGDKVNNNLYTPPSDDELFNALNYEGSPFVMYMRKSMLITLRKFDSMTREILSEYCQI